MCWPDAFLRYVVCNPTTEKWLVLSHSICSAGEAHLGFDPTVCSYFLMIEYVHEEGAGVGVDIYSSKTAVWIFKESERGKSIILGSHLISVFS